MSESTPAERWLPIAGFEGYYEVSDHGRVRSLNRQIIDKNGVAYRKRGRVLTPKRQHSGHLVVGLHKHAESVSVGIHILVLEAFVGPRPPGQVARHWDDVPTNNRVENLQWGTYSENVYDAIRNGIHPNASKTECYRGRPLRSPNLGLNMLRAGHRQCLACQRTRCHVRNMVKRGEIKQQSDADFQALADAAYARVLATGGRQRRRRTRTQHAAPFSPTRISPE